MTTRNKLHGDARLKTVTLNCKLLATYHSQVPSSVLDLEDDGLCGCHSLSHLPRTWMSPVGIGEHIHVQSPELSCLTSHWLSQVSHKLDNITAAASLPGASCWQRCGGAQPSHAPGSQLVSSTLLSHGPRQPAVPVSSWYSEARGAGCEGLGFRGLKFRAWGCGFAGQGFRFGAQAKGLRTRGVHSKFYTAQHAHHALDLPSQARLRFLLILQLANKIAVHNTHRPLSISLLGLPYGILNINHNKELLRRLWVSTTTTHHHQKTKNNDIKLSP